MAATEGLEAVGAARTRRGFSEHLRKWRRHGAKCDDGRTAASESHRCRALVAGRWCWQIIEGSKTAPRCTKPMEWWN